jgi:hypothetical protein
MDTLRNPVTVAVPAHPQEHAPQLSRLAQVGHFLRHFLEMCVAMCLGGSILNLLVFGAAGQLGYPTLRYQFPELALLVVAVNYTLPMVGWMWLRGMAWRPNLEMAGVAMGLAILLIGMTALGIVPRSSLSGLRLSFCGLACPLMAVAMLFRLDLYTGRTGHHAHMA